MFKSEDMKKLLAVPLRERRTIMNIQASFITGQIIEVSGGARL